MGAADSAGRDRAVRPVKQRLVCLHETGMPFDVLDGLKPGGDAALVQELTALGGTGVREHVEHVADRLEAAIQHRVEDELADDCPVLGVLEMPGVEADIGERSVAAVSVGMWISQVMRHPSHGRQLDRHRDRQGATRARQPGPRARHRRHERSIVVKRRSQLVHWRRRRTAPSGRGRLSRTSARSPQSGHLITTPGGRVPHVAIVACGANGSGPADAPVMRQ